MEQKLSAETTIGATVVDLINIYKKAFGDGWQEVFKLTVEVAVGGENKPKE